MVFALISFLIFVVYLVCVLRYIKRVPVSLSQTFYLLPQDKWYPYIFTFVLWAMSVLLYFPMFDITPEYWQFTVWLALVSIGFVGAAPYFKVPMDSKVHVTAAIISAVFGIAWSLIMGGWACLVVAFFCVLVAAMVTGTVKSSRTFWLEMIAFFTVYLTLFINLLQ